MTVSSKLALLGGEPVVPLGTSRPRWPLIHEEDVEAVTKHLRCHELSAYEVLDGPIFEFEKELTSYFGARYALLVANGTSALYSAISALRLRPEEEVVVPACTFPATGAPVLHLGATVRLADVDPETGNPTLEHLRSAINERTRAVMVAHAWGLPADMPSIVPFLRNSGIPLIEDAARAFGTRCGGQEMGSFGLAGCFSLHELKGVPGGEGGLLITSDRTVYERSVALGHYYRCKEALHLSQPDLLVFRDSGLGLNLQIHPLAAALARSQFRRSPQRLEILSRNRECLKSASAGLPGLTIQEVPMWAERVSHYGFNFHWRPDGLVSAPSRSTVVQALQAEGIGASGPGNPSLHQLPLFRQPGTANLPGRVAGTLEDHVFPGSVEHHRTLLRLPVLYEPDSQWLCYYRNALEKVTCSLADLHRWERTVGSPR